ncbi:hypothetical protein C2S51_032438 [Perilla frutescens var. frutescens]|nr:hypothetical protein C2S51_032438 [Perilla frutescens var. frutescens]
MVTKFGKAVSLKLLNTILDVLVKEDTDIARKFYRKKIMGTGLKGDDYTYGILMKGFDLMNRIGDGFKLLQIMKNHGVKVNVVVYNTLIHALCKNGKVGRARSLMNEMDKFSDVSFNILISAYWKVKAGCGFLRQMEMEGCLPNTETYNVLIEGLCESGMLDLALYMFHEMKRAGTRDGLELFELMLEDKGGSGGRVSSYNIILYGLYKDNHLGKALEFLNYMGNWFPHDVGHTLTILKFCQDSNVDESKQVFDEMSERGSTPSALVYLSLIQEYCKNGCMKEAVEMVNIEMIGRMYFPVASTFNALISGFYRQAKPRIAVRLMEDLNMRGCLPDSESYGVVVDAFCSQGDFQQVLMLYMQMMEKGIAPSHGHGTWNSLIMVALEGKNRLSEHKLLEWLMDN